MEFISKYYKALAKKLSNTQLDAQNGHHYGLYQISEKQLKKVGYISQGLWTGKYGVRSLDDFLKNKTIQEIAIREYFQMIWQELSDYHAYEGKSIKSCKLSQANMILAAYLGDIDELKEFIESDGRAECSDYTLSILKEFENFKLDLYLADFFNILEQQQRFTYDNPEYVIWLEDNLKLKQSELKNHIITQISKLKTYVPEVTQKRLNKAFEEMADKLKCEMRDEVLYKDLEYINICDEKKTSIAKVPNLTQGQKQIWEKYLLIAENLSSNSWNDVGTVIDACNEYLEEAFDKIKACKVSADFNRVTEDCHTFCEVVNAVLGVSEEEVTEMEI
ncbi:hypothetical protein [Candidatus Phycorickettsia trachydisci]|nr:hypothetical protein [Candidatus Phycorickettsia trachydisci]